MSAEELLPELPKELTEQGVRWVMVRNNPKGKHQIENTWRAMVLFYESEGLPAPYYCIDSMSRDIRCILHGYHMAKRECGRGLCSYSQMKEVGINPKIK